MSGCAGINGNNSVPNCRCPSSAILCPGDPDRHPVLVPPSGAVDDRSPEAGKILLQRGYPRLELAATLLAQIHWGLGVDDLVRFHRQDVVQHARTNEVGAEEAPEAELEDGVDGEGRRMVHDLDDGDPECGADSHCRRPPGDVDPLRAVARSRNRKARLS